MNENTEQPTTQNEGDYERQIRGLDAYGSVLTGLIKSILDVEEIKFHSVDYRVKSEYSASKKLVTKAEKYGNYGDITDLLGVRIITYFDDDVDKVADCIERQFSVDDENSEDKRALLESDRFGYLSVHYILSLDARRTGLPEYSAFDGVKFELQIRSVLQHAWAEVEHDLGYKSDGGLPKELRRGFSRLASLLEVADIEFIALRNRISDHKALTEKALSETPDDVLVNQTSLVELAKTNEAIRDADISITAALDFTGLQPFNIEYISKRVHGLRAVGLNKTGELTSYIKNHKQDISAFALAWISLGNRRRFPCPPGISFQFATLYKIYQLTPEARTAFAKAEKISEHTIRKMAEIDQKNLETK